MVEEYTRLSLLIDKRISLPALVLEDEPSERYNIRFVGAGNHNFSVLVELRRSNQTRHAAEGVRTHDSAETNRSNESVRCKLIRGMNAILRENQICAPGTGQDRKLRWQTTAQGETSSGLGHQQSGPVPTGNSANAATVAALRARKVSLLVRILALPRLTCI